MRLSYGLRNSEIQARFLELTRIGLFFLILAVSVISSIFQVGFINWSTLGPFYGILAAAFLLHGIWLSVWEKLLENPKWLFFGFVLDAFLISLLIYFSGVNQSLFLFLYLVNILLGGIACRGVGAITLALCTSIFFTAVALFSPEAKALNFFFLMALNNIAFFAVAGLSGYLSEQLQQVGTELSATGQKLRSVEELNRVLLENIPTGMISFLDSGEVITANRSAESILGHGRVISRNWFELVPGVPTIDFKGDINYSSSPESQAKTLGVTQTQIYSPELQENISIALFDDLTTIRRLEFAARQNEKLAAIGGLAAGIAHEIRNPLAGISGSIEMLSQTVNDDDDRKLMKIILREIDRLNGLITEFLEYAKPETPPTDIVDLAPLFSETLDSLKQNTQVPQNVVQVREYSEGLRILGKRDKLKQVFLNIFLNAYQAMDKTEKPQLEVRSVLGDGVVEVRVRDHGSGMSEETKKRMFEPFHTTKPKGTGLGLAVTHKILEGHGAKVFVESEPGKGTEFILTFPRAH